MPSETIQWFPGHMAKTRRMISENLKNVDIIIEILDARIPYASRNPEISRLTEGKPTLLLLNIPGTLYCLLYCILLLATNGLSLATSLSYHYIYFFGSLFGLFSIYLLFRWILAAKHRNKSIGGTGGVL